MGGCQRGGRIGSLLLAGRQLAIPARTPPPLANRQAPRQHYSFGALVWAFGRSRGWVTTGTDQIEGPTSARDQRIDRDPRDDSLGVQSRHSLPGGGVLSRK